VLGPGAGPAGRRPGAGGQVRRPGHQAGRPGTGDHRRADRRAGPPGRRRRLLPSRRREGDCGDAALEDLQRGPGVALTQVVAPASVLSAVTRLTATATGPRALTTRL